jgi:spermidine/putrescine transport system permease protein
MALLFLYFPILMIVVLAFNSGDQALVMSGFSVRWFGEALADPTVISAAINSLRLATISMVLATVLAFGLILTIDRLSRAGNAAAIALVSAPLILPEIVIAVATLGFIHVIGLQPGLAALIFAHTTFCIPFAMQPMRARLAQLNPAYFEAAADLGATNWAMFSRITFPMLRPGVISGALLAFIVSLDDYIISSFLSSAGTQTLPIYLFGLVRRYATPAVDAIAVMLLLVAVVVVVLTSLANREKKRKS